MSIPIPSVCDLNLFRLRSNEYATACATTGSTAVLVWLFHAHTAWPSPMRKPDMERAFIAGYVVVQYPTLQEQIQRQERAFANYEITERGV